jgi:hypothetical protein
MYPCSDTLVHKDYTIEIFKKKPLINEKNEVQYVLRNISPLGFEYGGYVYICPTGIGERVIRANIPGGIQ